jgi:hypothetical protein
MPRYVGHNASLHEWWTRTSPWFIIQGLDEAQWRYKWLSHTHVQWFISLLPTDAVCSIRLLSQPHRPVHLYEPLLVKCKVIYINLSPKTFPNPTHSKCIPMCSCTLKIQYGLPEKEEVITSTQQVIYWCRRHFTTLYLCSRSKKLTWNAPEIVWRPGSAWTGSVVRTYGAPSDPLAGFMVGLKWRWEERGGPLSYACTWLWAVIALALCRSNLNAFNRVLTGDKDCHMEFSSADARQMTLPELEKKTWYCSCLIVNPIMMRQNFTFS